MTYFRGCNRKNTNFLKEAISHSLILILYASQQIAKMLFLNMSIDSLSYVQSAYTVLNSFTSYDCTTMLDALKFRESRYQYPAKCT